MQYLFWLVLLTGHGITTMPVPYQSIEECEAAATEFHDNQGTVYQYGNCLAQPVDDVRQFHTNLMGPSYHD